jgi:hypothetical protein
MTRRPRQFGQGWKNFVCRAPRHFPRIQYPLTRSPSLLLFLLALLPAAAQAVELHIQFGALERMLAQTVFAQDGRRYVHNDKANKCNFAYLEKPHVRSDSGRLRIQARFTGRSALNMLGQCVGLGDAFDLAILATPEYRDGNLWLGNITVISEAKTGYYIRRVCSAMSATLGRDFHYPIATEFQKTLEDPAINPGYPRQLRRFQISAIQVGADDLVLTIDFELTVK